MNEEQVLPVLYVNAVKFVTSQFEVSMMMGITEPPPDKPDGQVEVSVRAYARMVMSPPHFKKFLSVAEGVLKEYEAKNGTIPIV